MNYYFSLFILIAFVSCSGSSEFNKNSDRVNVFLPNQEFKDYWYAGGGAEITSYNLTQARYGEERQGTAVFIFVTEPFDPEKFVKPDSKKSNDVEVLKLNYTKNFVTGVYPYSMMTSSFYPLNGVDNSLKISSSSQEWCGHTFMQLTRKNKLNVLLHSYFESEGEQNFELTSAPCEDDIFSQIRINPEDITTGKRKMVPSLFFLRLKHVECKAYDVEILRSTEGKMSTITLNYPQLKRSMKIKFDTAFPYVIQSFEERYDDSFNNAGTYLVTKAVLNKQIRSKYWEHHSNLDSDLRKQLGL